MNRDQAAVILLALASPTAEERQTRAITVVLELLERGKDTTPQFSVDVVPDQPAREFLDKIVARSREGGEEQ